MDEQTIIAVPRVDIIAHSKGGWAYSIKEADSSGVETDISAKAFSFKTESGLNVAAIADPDNPLGLKIALTEAQVAAIYALPDHSTKYAIIDTTADPDDPLAYGRFQVEGWT